MTEPTLAEKAIHASTGALDSMGRSLDQGAARVRDVGGQVRESAAHASETAVTYIRHDPLKSVLIAAATGAALMALVSLLTRPHGHR